MPKRKADTGGGSKATPGEEDGSQAVLDDVLRVVRDCLVKLRAGDLFMADLDKECYDQLTPATNTDEDGNEKMTRVFKAFLGAVADTLAAETTMDYSNDAKMVKKMRKKWNKLLKEHFEAVEEEVNKELAKAGGGKGQAAADADDQDQEMADADADADADDAGSTAAAAAGKDDEDNDLTSEHEFDDDDDESAAESRGSSKRSKSSKSSKSSSKKKSKKAKRKAKKKKREKKKKRKAREMADLDASDADDGGGGSSAFNGMSREEAREMFVRERDETLSQVPKDVKDRFRGCGFATWGKVVYPIIELGPYDVPPGDLRDQWFAMFENCQKSQRAMTRLIYWYGTENLEEGYSFYQANKIMSYEKGSKKGSDKVPPGIQKKLDSNKKLTKTDKQIVKGLEQIVEDAQLEPSERVAWLPEWEEDWEDDDNFDDDLEEEDEEEDMEDDDSTTAPRSKKKGSKRKKGKDDLSSSKKRKKKKGKKRKKAGDDSADDDLDDDENDAGHKSGASSDDNSSAPVAAKSNKKKAKSSKVIYKDDKEEPEEMKVASDDEKDEDFSDEVSSSSEEEEEYVEGAGGGSGGPKKRKRKGDSDDASGRKKKGSGEPKAKREKKQGGANKGPKVNSKAAEQRYFDECEDLFLPLMRELKVAIGADDLKTCELCVMKFQRYVEKVTPTFIRIHQFGLVVKESRKAFKSKGRDDLVSLCHELTKDLKRIYTNKLPLMPEGFEPKIRRQKKKDASSAKKKKPKVEEEDPASDDEDDRKASTNAKVSNGAGQATVVDISKKCVDDEPAKSMAPEKKAAFSLKGMFQRPQKAAPAVKEKKADRASLTVQRPGGTLTKQIPSWLKGPSPVDTGATSSDDRSLALEFLEDAFSYFPEGKIDANAASIALESAINDWSAARSDKSEVYWEKTHDIVAALSVTVEPTSLAQELLDGKYETPRDLLRITRKRLNGYVGELTD